MKIQGLQRLTLLDYPGKAACTVFTPGCNFRCPFCHNSTLVYGEGENIEIPEVMRFLDRRRRLLDGVCISGGEPLLQNDIESFIRKVRDMGFLIKLDTNGSLPDRLKSLVMSGLIDYVAMDIKNSPSKYAMTSGCNVDFSLIKESIDFLISSPRNTDYEFRTTTIREYHEKRDFEEIAQLIKGCKRYRIQAFIDSGGLICDGLQPLEKSEMLDIVDFLNEKGIKTELRGI